MQQQTLYPDHLPDRGRVGLYIGTLKTLFSDGHVQNQYAVFTANVRLGLTVHHRTDKVTFENPFHIKS